MVIEIMPHSQLYWISILVSACLRRSKLLNEFQTGLE